MRVEGVNKLILGLLAALLALTAANLYASTVQQRGRYPGFPEHPLVGQQLEGGQDQLTVSGTYTLYTSPDEIYVNLAVEVEGQDPGSVLDEASTRAGRVIEGLRSLGVPDKNMSTTGISIAPMYDYDVRPPKIVGYKAAYSLTVRVTSAELAGKVIDTGIELGATRIDSLRFGASDERIRELYLRALELAVDNAMRKAEVVAASAGVSLGRIRLVKVEDVYVPIRYFEYSMEALSAAKGAATPVLEKQISVTARVTVVYEIGQ